MYKDYLKSSHWKKVKLLHYENEKNSRCFICKSVFSLNVHHIIYKTRIIGSLLGQENKHLDLLKTLCGDCHHLWHKYHNRVKLKAMYRDRIVKLINKGFSKERAFYWGAEHKWRQIPKTVGGYPIPL